MSETEHLYTVQVWASTALSPGEIRRYTASALEDLALGCRRAEAPYGVLPFRAGESIVGSDTNGRVHARLYLSADSPQLHDIQP